jgi:hypothetical protein
VIEEDIQDLRRRLDRLESVVFSASSALNTFNPEHVAAAMRFAVIDSGKFYVFESETFSFEPVDKMCFEVTDYLGLLKGREGQKTSAKLKEILKPFTDLGVKLTGRGFE